jgi:autotransporter-associated beta strand protein
MVVANSGATDYTWQGGDGAFTNSAKWSPASVPAAGDRAKFSTAADGIVEWTGPVTNNEMVVSTMSGKTLVLNLGGNAYTLTNRFSFETDKASSYLAVSNGVFTSQTNVCEVKINSGVAPARLTFANGALATMNWLYTWRSDVNVQSGAVLTCNNECKIGDGQANSVNALSVNGGTLTNNSHLWINGGNNSTSTLAVTSGSMVTKGYFSIGNGGSGTAWGIFNLSGGYLETQGQLWIGNAGSTRGVANVSGGQWVAKQDFEVAHGGYTISSVNISGGEIVMSSGKNFILANKGNGHNTTGTLAMVGGRISVTNNSAVYMGYASNGLGRCYMGGAAELYARDLKLGAYATARGECLVTGGLVQVVNNLVVGDVKDGYGWMRIDGGTVTNLAPAYVGNNSGSTGSLELASGSLFFNNDFLLGNSAQSSGTFTQTGGALLVKGATYVGNGGAGTFLVAGGNTTFSNVINCGNSAGSTGTLMLAGGVVTGTSGEWGSRAGAVVLISGGTNTFSGGPTVGAYTQGVLRITGGSNTFGGLTIGRNNFGASGTMTVTGGQTTVTGYLDVGAAGLGVLDMAGGELTAAYLRISPATTTNPVPPQSQIRVTGGTFKVVNYCYFPDTTSVTGRLTLAGGVFAVPELRQWWGKLHVLFDGGTLQATRTQADFINNLDWYALTGNGLVMDSAGFNVGTALVLPDAAGEHGRLVKKGAGVFTLNAANTFTGPVVVQGGTLALGGSGLITLAGGCVVEGGALLDLSARTLDFTLPAGTVSRVDGELRLASGKTLTVTNGATLSGTGVVGRVVLASGATLARDASSGSALLRATECVIPAGATIALAGYSTNALWQGVSVVAGTTLTVAQGGAVAVTLDGVPQSPVALRVSGGVLTAQRVNPGTLFTVR